MQRLFGRSVSLMALACLLAGRGVSAGAADRTAPVHNVDGAFVREWLVLGPFPSKQIEPDFLVDVGGEANVRPKEGDAITTKDGTRLIWTRFGSKYDTVNLEQLFGIQQWSVTYVYCELNSDRAIETDLRGYDSWSSALWLNGKKAGQIPAHIWRRPYTTLSLPILSPVSPISLNAGRNSCLLKIRRERGEWSFSFQPLPAERATPEVHVTEPGGKNVADALVEFYAQSELAGRVTTDETGKAEACLFPLAEAYDLRVTAGEIETWRFNVALRPGERRKLGMELTNTVSISGRVLALDGSPQDAIVVQAIRVPDPSNPGRADLPVRPDIRAAQQRSPTEGAKIRTLLPMPFFSRTVHTDTNGNYRFVNLQPGQYRLRCHGSDGYIYPDGGQEPGASKPILIEPGRTQAEINFVIPEVKKGFWKTLPLMIESRQGTHYSVYRTPDGALWVGTEDLPLHRYDGVEYKSFPVADRPEDTIHAMDCAPDGSLWIGGANGISRIVGGQFKPLSLADQLPRNGVRDVLADADGSVWFGTKSGLCKYDGRRFVRFTTHDGLPGNWVNSLLRTADGALWIATGNRLVLFEGRDFSEPEAFLRFGIEGPINSLHQARDGAIWFSGLRGAYRYDGKTLLRLGKEEGLLDDEVNDIAETSDGVLWFATWAGISRFNGTTVLNYTPADGLNGKAVLAIHVDSDDVLWCAGKALNRFDPKGFLGFSRRDGIINHTGGTAGVLDIKRESPKALWIGTGWAGAFRTDGKKLEAIPPREYVRQVHRAADGTLWFGTRNGIVKYENGRMVRVLGRNYVNALTSDQEGNLWYGDQWEGGGLTRFNPKTGQETTFTTADGLPDNHVWSIEPASDGGVWFGTQKGLARFQNGRLEDFREKLGMPAGVVWNIRRDPDETLWISGALGLHRLNGTEHLSITVTNGLPDEDIQCSAQTRDGIVWMGSEKHGLLGYDGKAVTVIDARDGLGGHEVRAMLCDPDDSLWVGTNDGGLTHFRRSKTHPSVRLLEVEFDGQTLADFSNPAEPEIGTRVNVQYQEIDLKTHPDKRQFWYQVKGPSGKTLYAAVTKDRHFEWRPREGGAYTFEVQAIDRDLNYSQPATLTFHATVPWYENAWITMPGGGTFGGLVIWAFVARALYARKRREAVRLREQMLVQERQAREALEKSHRSLAEAKEAAEEARQSAETANQAKSTFLANMSHEIRTPLNAILGFSDLLNGIVNDPKERSFVTAISSSGKSLLTIINDILDLSKIEAGRMELHYEPVCLRELLTEIAQVFSQKAEEKGLELEINVAEGLPDGLLLDEVRLRQILFNVIGNAVKFTDQGTIRISASSQTHESEESLVDLSLQVADSGIGIPPGELDRIFETFTQVTGQSTRKYGGTGLGLAITKRLTEMMKGTVRVESQVGAGTTFRFEFGAVAVAAVTRSALPDRHPSLGLEQFQPSTILVVEDHPMNRRLMAAYFENTKHRLVMATNGREAVEEARKEKPDVILMDIHMPEMDGWEASGILKSDARLKSIPIIVITASPLADRDSRTRGLCDGFLRKPVSKSDLIEVMALFLPRAASPVEPAPTMSKTEASPAPTSGNESPASPELISLLEGQLHEVWPGLCERPNIAQIEKFALRLAGWAETYGSQELLQFAQTLHQHAEQFDTERLAHTLRQFPEILHSLASALGKA